MYYIEVLKTENKALLNRITNLETENTRLKEELHDFDNLLAVIHKDGGQYQRTFGTKGACERASEIVCGLRIEKDSLKAERDAAIKSLSEWSRKAGYMQSAADHANKRYTDLRDAIRKRFKGIIEGAGVMIPRIAIRIAVDDLLRADKDSSQPGR